MTTLKMPLEVVQCLNFINGEWVKGEAGTQNITSPYHGKKIGEVSIPSLNQIKNAMKIASDAQVEWGRTPHKERARVLFNFRNILLRDLEEISHLKSAESGKTFNEGMAGLMKGIEVLEYALSLQNMDVGGRMEVSRGVSCEYRRTALGVVANITPFNFPAMVPMWTIPIALGLGNAYVWKPSDKTPLTSIKIASALKEAGLPNGLFTVLHGGAETVDAIIEAPEVKAVGFVGSTKIAKLVYTKATSLGKRALCMGGAKNHIVLLPDATPDIAGVGISDSFTGCAGQRCMAASVLLAVGDVDQHITKIKNRAESLKLGTDMGAIITRAQRDFLLEAITRAEKAGAKVVLDGRTAKAPAGMEEGNWIGPTILDNIQPGSEAATVELFGPVLSVVRCKDITHAMQIQNSSEYGNACSVFTNSGALADRVTREAKAGMVGVNVGVPVPREPFSFGGIAASKFGSGDITGEHSLNFWSDVKKVTTKWEKQNDNNWMS
ncbi:aldehyde dehydrogenase family protein [Peredibacter starrii]|uniref:Aldehyde dehydrogenase family protein n=1 Tax=Peredibacter starrii TaxID=28202 RepID=A0AAX4HV79_9BACT|nr:aldehyde dehydrogenase family protein [Peredibacter starrii]WPU66886.1 aldehyde dehydrogenase family protein [Peredibacter starrii]